MAKKKVEETGAEPPKEPKIEERPKGEGKIPAKTETVKDDVKPVGGNITKGSQQCFDSEGGMTDAPIATITHKPKAVPVEIKLANNKFKLNTTEEGLANLRDKSNEELRAWIIPKMKVLKDADIFQGDFDMSVSLMMDIIQGKAKVNEVEGGKQASVAQ